MRRKVRKELMVRCVMDNGSSGFWLTGKGHPHREGKRLSMQEGLGRCLSCHKTTVLRF